MNAAPAPAQTEQDAEMLRRFLVEVGDATQAVLHELSTRPSLERCDRALVQLRDAREVVLRYHLHLGREGGADGA